ncbi:MBL fold metallo-hydrolase [Flavobacterium fluviale]|uniref:Metallo-beta-lactamase domain-containing protein n=1 Tax=Flavobacterium fluviale TaxID=2249356 RepID=A0A344LTU6_9FLAO|nr:MBL fold metallo-hydrolase [Flavobacterium fluviale]AXB57338.1 hypothetical protein HYN86_12345 [Flavobacterium fluviale]
MEIIALQHGVYCVDSNKNFKFVSENADAQISDLGLMMQVCPFLIQTNRDLILFDGGLSDEQGNFPLILKLIKNAGFSAQNVSKILISPLHKDHIGGLAYGNGSEFSCTFPNAEIYLQNRELDFA